MGDHLSGPPVTRRLWPRTRFLGGQRHRNLLRVAPDGVWLAAASPRRWWALTPPFHPYPGISRVPVAVSFLCHFPSAFAAWGFPSVLPCGVRTFLEPLPARGHPACTSILARYDCCSASAASARATAADGSSAAPSTHAAFRSSPRRRPSDSVSSATNGLSSALSSRPCVRRSSSAQARSRAAVRSPPSGTSGSSDCERPRESLHVSDRCVELERLRREAACRGQIAGVTGDRGEPVEARGDAHDVAGSTTVLERRHRQLVRPLLVAVVKRIPREIPADGPGIAAVAGLDRERERLLVQTASAGRVP